MKIEKVKGYECGNCGTVYEDDDSADNCCPNEVNEVDAWKCGECDEFYDTEEDAEECCKDEEN